MKLHLLHEMATTTAMIAAVPMALGGMRPRGTKGKKKRGVILKDDTEVISEKERYGKKPRQHAEKVWQGIPKSFKSKSGNITAGGDPYGPKSNPILPSLGAKGFKYP